MIGSWPDPYPDELFYSICARFSERVRYPSKRSIVVELFGTGNAIACVSLPSHLGHFVSQLPPYGNYTVNRIIDQHTLLPYFAPFLPPERHNRLCQDMCSNNGPALHMERRSYGESCSSSSMAALLSSMRTGRPQEIWRMLLAP